MKMLKTLLVKPCKKKVIENKEIAYLSQKLVTIVDDIDFGIGLDDLKLKTVDRDQLYKLLEELEFKSFEKKFFKNGNGLKHDEKLPAPVEPVQVKITQQLPSEIDCIDEWSLEDFHNRVDPYSDLRVIETDRGRFFNYKKQLIQFNGEDKELGSLLGEKYVKWSGFDLKSTWQQLQLINPQISWDQMLAAYVVHPKNVDTFEKAFEEHCGEKVPDLATPGQVLNCHLKLEHELSHKLVEVKGVDVYKHIELPLVSVLYEMERNGVRIDVAELQKQSTSLGEEIHILQGKIHKEAGESFNISSPKQLGAILFEKMQLQLAKKQKQGTPQVVMFY